MYKKLLYILGLLIMRSFHVAAQHPASGGSTLDHPLALMLLVIIIGLFIAIIILGNVVIHAVDIYRERMNKEQGKAPLLIAGILAAGCLVASPAHAQGTPGSPLSASTFYTLSSVIALELLVLVVLLWVLRVLTGIAWRRAPKTRPAARPAIGWWERINRTRTVDTASEQSEDMGHDFDGIRELNNPTPPWWKWGFISSFAFAVVYLWVYHVSHSAPLQLEELTIAENKAAAAKEAYLAHAANNIDEHSVKLLSEQGELAAGQKLFGANCAPCHGAAGQGVVGPNLTDSYWLHGGKINDIFSTIKYGVPEKGMKSWKDDFSPKQLAQLASFIKSIHDTHPAGAKAPQGTQE